MSDPRPPSVLESVPPTDPVEWEAYARRVVAQLCAERVAFWTGQVRWFTDDGPSPDALQALLEKLEREGSIGPAGAYGAWRSAS